MRVGERVEREGDQVVRDRGADEPQHEVPRLGPIEYLDEHQAGECERSDGRQQAGHRDRPDGGTRDRAVRRGGDPVRARGLCDRARQRRRARIPVHGGIAGQHRLERRAVRDPAHSDRGGGPRKRTRRRRASTTGSRPVRTSTRSPPGPTAPAEEDSCGRWSRRSLSTRSGPGRMCRSATGRSRFPRCPCRPRTSPCPAPGAARPPRRRAP